MYKEVYGNRHRDAPALDGNNNIIDFRTHNNSSISFRFNQR